MKDDRACPCGSGLPSERCCLLYIDGGEWPDTAGQLMRSRYTAYVLGRRDYLLQSWHARTRPGALAEAAGIRWLSLSITATEQGTAADVYGRVHFVAAFIEHGRCMRLCENSRFEKVDGRWYYVDGHCEVRPVGRNEPCPCGSGRKSKRCCIARQV